MDGKEPSVFIADEVGALPTPYAVEAMRSGQLMVINKLGFIISTKYPTMDNPFEDEVANCKNILDGIIEDETVFALLYEPNETKDWTFDDNIILQANPLAVEIETVYLDILNKRTNAINREMLRENFLTKHCNIVYQGAGTENFIDVNNLQKCKVANDKEAYNASQGNTDLTDRMLKGICICTQNVLAHRVIRHCIGKLTAGEHPQRQHRQDWAYRAKRHQIDNGSDWQTACLSPAVGRNKTFFIFPLDIPVYQW